MAECSLLVVVSTWSLSGNMMDIGTAASGSTAVDAGDDDNDNGDIGSE